MNSIHIIGALWRDDWLERDEWAKLEAGDIVWCYDLRFETPTWKGRVRRVDGLLNVQMIGRGDMGQTLAIAPAAFLVSAPERLGGRP